jgi:hypothetical protein
LTKASRSVFKSNWRDDSFVGGSAVLVIDSDGVIIVADISAVETDDMAATVVGILLSQILFSSERVYLKADPKVSKLKLPEVKEVDMLDVIIHLITSVKGKSRMHVNIVTISQCFR